MAAVFCIEQYTREQFKTLSCLLNNSTNQQFTNKIGFCVCFMTLNKMSKYYFPFGYRLLLRRKLGTVKLYYMRS